MPRRPGCLASDLHAPARRGTRRGLTGALSGAGHRHRSTRLARPSGRRYRVAGSGGAASPRGVMTGRGTDVTSAHGHRDRQARRNRARSESYEQGRECQQEAGREADRGAHGAARRARGGARTPGRHRGGRHAGADRQARGAPAQLLRRTRRPRPRAPRCSRRSSTPLTSSASATSTPASPPRAPIGRVNIRDAAGRLQGYGTGSLVSPTLLLTNHHVLPDADTARHSAIEFNYQDGIDGRPLLAQLLPFDPDRFFLADDERDFALVAVSATPAELAPFGFNRLIEAEGKAIIGEFVTIVQHPRGEKKQVALRENRIVDIPERFLHYSADTEPGSSGSLVFNDQWEAVALHHASVPAPEHRELGGFVNEGIRDQPDHQVHQGAAAAAGAARARRPALRAPSAWRPPRRRHRRGAAGPAVVAATAATGHDRGAAGRRGHDHGAGPDHRAGRRRGRRSRRRPRRSRSTRTTPPAAAMTPASSRSRVPLPRARDRRSPRSPRPSCATTTSAS